MISNVSIQELFARAKPRLVPEDITWDGQTATVYFQRLSMSDSADIAMPFLNENGSGIDKAKIKNFQATLIAKTVRDEAGKEVITEADVLGVDSAFYRALTQASEKHNPSSAAALEDIAKNSSTTPSNDNS